MNQESKQENKPRVTKEMTIGDFVQKYPSAVEILMAEGVHCVGCGASVFESIEDGLTGHGKTPEADRCAVFKDKLVAPHLQEPTRSSGFFVEEGDVDGKGFPVGCPLEPVRPGGDLRSSPYGSRHRCGQQR